VTLPSAETANLETEPPFESGAPFAKISPPAQASGAVSRTEWRPTGTSSKRAAQVLESTGVSVT
jgi:hypothetical protein